MTRYSRDQWGARPARGGPGPLWPSRVEGIAIHWPAMSKPLTSVAAVKAALKGWQNYHMDDQGWSDIGYQVAVDQDGNRYELRGLSAQSGANGGTDVNERFGACLLILAPGEKPTPAMVAEVQAVVTDHRTLFPRSNKIVGHTDIRPEPTACPGPAALAAIRAGTFEPQEEADMALTAKDVSLFLRRKLTKKGDYEIRNAFLMIRKLDELDAIKAELQAIRALLEDSDTPAPK